MVRIRQPCLASLGRDVSAEGFRLVRLNSHGGGRGGRAGTHQMCSLLRYVHVVVGLPKYLSSRGFESDVMMTY